MIVFAVHFLSKELLISPFAMADLTEEDVAEMMQYFENLQNATALITADYKAARAQLAVKMPGDVEGVM